VVTAKDQLWTYDDFTLAYLHRMNITILLNLLDAGTRRDVVVEEIQQQQKQQST